LVDLSLRLERIDARTEGGLGKDLKVETGNMEAFGVDCFQVLRLFLQGAVVDCRMIARMFYLIREAGFGSVSLPSSSHSFDPSRYGPPEGLRST
jgi:hypothetical protein